jgi:hypothetical protein
MRRLGWIEDVTVVYDRAYRKRSAAGAAWRRVRSA